MTVCASWQLGKAFRALWTPGSGYHPRRDDPHKRPVLKLRENADARLRRGHPWVFPREIHNIEALEPYSPCLVNIQASDGDLLGVALYNKRGTIAARVLSSTPGVQINAAFFASRLQQCLAYRERLFPEPFYRLVHGEADGLPGLVADRYDDHICVQITAAGLDVLLWPIMDALEEILQPKVVVARQDAPGRRREGAPVRREVLKGQYRGPTELRENGVTFAVDLLHGQKTGWYFDHRDHRALLATLAPHMTRVLDLYSYVGGFGVTLAHYGAEHVVCVDSSESALELCRRAATMNSVGRRVQTIRADVFDFLNRSCKDENQAELGIGTNGYANATPQEEKYDLVVLDPPNLGGDRTNAAKGIRFYERLVCAAAGLCTSPGLLFVGCCTYHISEAELTGAVNRALKWAGRPARLVSSGGQAADHPGHLALPESRYLRALLLHLE